MYDWCLADGWAGHPRDRTHCHPTDRPLDHSREHPRNHPPDCPTAPPKQFAVVLCVLLDGVGWVEGGKGGVGRKVRSEVMKRRFYKHMRNSDATKNLPHTCARYMVRGSLLHKTLSHRLGNRLGELSCTIKFILERNVGSSCPD